MNEHDILQSNQCRVGKDTLNSEHNNRNKRGSRTWT
jgi:hypothetical protein